MKLKLNISDIRHLIDLLEMDNRSMMSSTSLGKNLIIECVSDNERLIIKLKKAIL